MNRGNRAAGQHLSFIVMISRILAPQLVAALLLLPSLAGAENLFVSPNIDIPVRRGAGEQYKIIKMVRVNDKTELLEEKNGWFKIRFQDGDEGWLPKSLLTSAVPVAEDVKALRTENEQLQRKNSELSVELNSLKEHQDGEGGKLAECIAEQNKIKAERRASEDTGKALWFLAGGGVLLAGWLLGRISQSPQRRKSGLR
jgi:SH3 domain protein